MRTKLASKAEPQEVCKKSVEKKITSLQDKKKFRSEANSARVNEASQKLEEIQKFHTYLKKHFSKSIYTINRFKDKIIEVGAFDQLDGLDGDLVKLTRLASTCNEIEVCGN